MGHDVTGLNCEEYYTKNKWWLKVTFRLVIGEDVERLNRDIIRLATEKSPNVFWADKVLSLRPSTLQTLKSMGITTLSYMIDNAFGPRKDPGWRLYKKTIPFFDLHCTQRDVSIVDLMRRGAKEVIKIQTAYDRTSHFPPPESWSDDNRDRDVSFIGTPYDDRADFLSKLSDAGLPIVVSGPRGAWKKALTERHFDTMFQSGELWDDAYREAIWKSKINLSFVTKGNQDEYSHKAFEIAGCGGFLLVERSDGHAERFRDGQEAIFFSSVAECEEKIRLYLGQEQTRRRIAIAGRNRAERSGYHNDAQLQLILDKLDTLLPR
jgi:spore maturation protein CgeB